MAVAFEGAWCQRELPSNCDAALYCVFRWPSVLQHVDERKVGSGTASILLQSRYTCQDDVFTHRSDASIYTIHAYLVGTESNQRAKSFMGSKDSRILTAAPSRP